MIGGRPFLIFSIAFSVIYVMCMHYNISLFAYYPQLREFHAHVLSKTDGPAMYYYGWLFNALLGAAVIALGAALLPARAMVGSWSGLAWAVPGAMLILAVYYSRQWFLN